MPMPNLIRSLAFVVMVMVAASARAAEPAARSVDFNREIRPILSNRCYACHGPDAGKRKGVNKPFRLDSEDGAFADLGGYWALVRGKPDQSELIARITSDDPTEVMPPPAHGTRLPAVEVEKLTEWVRQGAKYARHWSYVKPTRPELPVVRDSGWPRNPVDRFLLARMEREGVIPSPEADRETLIRRLSLDLTGLPPTLAEVAAFARDPRPDAYERLVDGLLDRPAYGERWAHAWLDLARYADSAGYADDPPRVIWAYRDYVIRSFNANKPFDRMTLEQIAGDLLPDAGEEGLIATAFHRNTTTNNEGGTVDEEFRNAAVVDRVNTTMAVWMGTTIACAQCHDHKFDPISQADYFRFFAFFNNTEDADRTDESPRLPLFSPEQKQRMAAARREAESFEQTLRTATPELAASQAEWEKATAAGPDWQPARPTQATNRDGSAIEVDADGTLLVAPNPDGVATVTLPLNGPRLAGVRFAMSPVEGKGGGLVVNRVRAALAAPGGSKPVGRFVRIELPGAEKYLSLAEVQVFRDGKNLARDGEATQSSTGFDGPARLAIDGNTNGEYNEAKSTTHTAIGDASPWWEVDLKQPGPVDRIVVWNRTDFGLGIRLAGARVIVLDGARKPVWSETLVAPGSSIEIDPAGGRALTFAAALADGVAAPEILAGRPEMGQRRVGKIPDRPQTVTLALAEPVAVEAGATLTIAVEQGGPGPDQSPVRFRFATSADPRSAKLAKIPARVLAILQNQNALSARSVADRAEVERYYLAEVAPSLQPAREGLATVQKLLANMKPETSVPIQRELAASARRPTRIQRRGNYQDLGDEVKAGTPGALVPLATSDGPVDRLALARWLVSPDNPLTARVVANRYWEDIFGAGLVPTSEEFGSQGEPPTHPELLDWLATELVGTGWDLKRFVRLLVTSAAYRQSSKVTADQLHLDPGNAWLARGPRFRLPAETVRDQALAVAGLLSPKQYGPPVRPPQPATGLSAAFGGGIDWMTSPSPDRYRRALYTTWRRSNPYPSLTTFDAPNREVCTVRRTRTNTPLQALVTLNDPVFVEAAQALARRISQAEGDEPAKIRHAVRLCLARDPSASETHRLAALYESTRQDFATDPEGARKLATDPLGPAPAGSDLADLASWTVVANVLLNLDEMVMKR